MIYQEKFKMGLKDIGKDNKAKNRTLLEFLENVAAYHADYVKNGANDTLETRLGWILLDWKLQVIKRPRYGEILTINTWGKEMKKFFTYRDYEIYNEKQELCAIATSKWALIDIEKRKMARLTDEIIDKYKPEEKGVFTETELEKVEVPQEFLVEIDYTVIRRDIDINMHMHNLYYLDLAYEVLPQEVYDQRPFDNVRIMYKKEIKLGDTIKCHYTKKDDKHIVVIDSENGKVLHSVIELW